MPRYVMTVTRFCGEFSVMGCLFFFFLLLAFGLACWDGVGAAAYADGVA
jgi:hypothetical protein